MIFSVFSVKLKKKRLYTKMMPYSIRMLDMASFFCKLKRSCMLNSFAMKYVWILKNSEM